MLKYCNHKSIQVKAKSLNQLLYTHKKRRSEQFWWPQKINTVWRLANELLNSFRCFFFISTYFKSIIIGVIEWNVLPLRKSNANALFFKYSFTKHCFNGCAGMFTTLPELVFFSYILPLELNSSSALPQRRETKELWQIQYRGHIWTIELCIIPNSSYIKKINTQFIC